MTKIPHKALIVRVKRAFFNFKPPSVNLEWLSYKRRIWYMNRLDLGKFYLTHDKIPANGAWSGPGAEFLDFGTACIYLDRIKLDTSNFANSCNVASTSQLNRFMSNY